MVYRVGLETSEWDEEVGLPQAAPRGASRAGERESNEALGRPGKSAEGSPARGERRGSARIKTEERGFPLFWSIRHVLGRP